MSQSAVLGYAAQAVGRQLEPFTYEPPKLSEHDIRVSVTHCGLCHSDIHAIDNYYGMTTFPFVPGHEIVGHVSAVGPAVVGLKEGDRVGIGWQGRSCMKCEWCLQGEPHLCMDIKNIATWSPYGGFSSSVVADYRFAYPLPPAMPSEVAAVLMCAGLTVYSPLRTYVAGPKLKVAILGVGGLGHLAIQFAHAMGCEVTVISSSPDKKEQALAFGADRFIDSNNPKAMLQAMFNFDLLLCTATSGINWELLIMTLKKKGRLVLLGFPNVAFNPTGLVAGQISMTGSFVGNQATMREMLSIAQERGIKPAVELMPMAQVNDAIQRVRDNKARYRIVLVNEAAAADSGH